MGRLFVRGDTHGNFDFLPYFCEEYETTYSDVLVILGDAGILYYGANSKKEQELKEHLSTFPITLFCVRGNHERRPEECDIPIIHSDLLNGDVYQQSEYSNILYALDGGEYSFNSNSILTIGGAYSIDKDYRIAQHWYWNEHEQLTEEEMDRIAAQVDGKYYDFIFTHTCPYLWEPTELFLRGIDQSKVDNTMEHWLQRLTHKITWCHWYWGHFHGNKEYPAHIRATMLFDEIREIA